MLKIILKKINALLFLKFNQGLNRFMTLYVNVSLLPFKDAIKFPILIYGKCYACNLSGKIIFDKPIQKGLLVLGQTDPVRSFDKATVINLAGTVYVHGISEIRRGLHLQVNPNSSVELGNNVFIGDNVTIICSKSIKIGANTRIGNSCTFMDTDFHYIVNTITKTVHPASKSIDIGINNWIAGYNVIKKGAKTPKGTILAGPYSMIGKDYSLKINEYSIIGGSPAKLICENYRRINNSKQQAILHEYFQNNTDFYKYSDSVDFDVVCVP